MSIAFRGTADLPQQALLDSFEAPDQTAADAADPGAAATSADDYAAQRAQQGAAAAQPVIPWQQRMPPLAIDSPAFTIKQSAPAVQREARDGGGNGAGDGDVGGGGTGGRSGGDTSRSPGGRDAPAASVQPSAGNGSLVRVPVLPQTSARANIGTPDPVHDRGSWIGSPASDQDRTYRILPVGRPQGEMLVDGGAPPADARVSDQEPVYRILPVGGAQGEVLFDDTAPPASAPASDQEPVYRILPVGGAHGVWIDEAQSIFGERTPANHGTVKTTRDGASTTAAPPPATASTAAVLEAAMQAARQAAPPGAATAAAAGAAPAAAAAPAPAPTATTGTAQPAQPQPQQQQQQPTPAAAPGIDDAWAQDRRSAMGSAQQAYQAARAQAEAAGQFLTTVTESDESSSREVVVFDEAAFTQAWLTGGSGAANAGLQTLARLYGMTDAQALIAQRRDVVDLALARGTSVGLYEGAPPAGHAMSSAQELQALDGILYSDMNRVLVAQFGSGPVEPPRTALAQEQLRRYGQGRYEQMARIERAQAHIQGDFARALEQARNDPNSVGWHEVQEQVQVREGPVDESGQATGPTVTRTITRREFSVDRFSEWYTRAPSQEELAALQANPTAAGSAELLSRIAFAQLYGAAHEVVVYLGSDESGCAIEQREVRFTVQMGGQQHELTLQGERLVQSGFVAVNLNDPPRLNDQAGVFWNPLLGWSTHESNIHHSRDWFETIVTVVIIAAVSYVSAGTLGPAVAGALGATAGTIGAAVVTGAVVGATTAVVSGAISGNFSWRHVLQGMVLGGVGGAMSLGVNALAQGAADGALQAAAAGDPTAWDAARSTMNTVRSVGAVVQGGITSELGGGDFGEGMLGAMGNVAAGSVGNQVTQGLVDNQIVGEPMARVIGGVAAAGVSSVIVNARGADGDNAFVSGVVNTGVGLLPPESSAVPETGSADYRNGSDIESDAADAARREQQWVQQSDEIIARRGAEATNGADALASANAPPAAATPEFEMPWIPLALFDSTSGSSGGDRAGESTGESDSERAAAADRRRGDTVDPAPSAGSPVGNRTVDEHGNWSEELRATNPNGTSFTLRAFGDAAGTWRTMQTLDATGTVVQSAYQYQSAEGTAVLHYDRDGHVWAHQIAPADGGEVRYYMGDGTDSPVPPEVYGERLEIAGLASLGMLDTEGGMVPVADRGSRASRANDAASRVFTVERLMALPSLQVQGAGDARLVAAMNTLMPTRDAQSGELVQPQGAHVQEALATIAEVRGVPLERIQEDYAEYQRRATDAERRADRLGQRPTGFVEGGSGEHRVPMLSSNITGLVTGTNGPMQDNAAHMGSLTQLRFGSLVGEALGIDPVFGALLSPTGGIPGAGNERVGQFAVSAAGGRDVVTSHGTAHDAAGYLLSYHGMGPGYNYVPNLRDLLSDTNPLAGQSNGLNFYYNLRRYGDPYYRPPSPGDGT